MRIALLAPAYLPPTAYFHAIAQADIAVVDTSMRYDKRAKAVHRTRLDGIHGKAFMTVPVTLPGSTHCLWNDVKVSAHGQWWRVQRSTLDTLYGNTPFYDDFRHDFLRFINQDYIGQSIIDLDIASLLIMCKLGNIHTPMSATLDARYLHDAGVEVVDMRNHDFYADNNVSAIEQLFSRGTLL